MKAKAKKNTKGETVLALTFECEEEAKRLVEMLARSEGTFFASGLQQQAKSLTQIIRNSLEKASK